MMASLGKELEFVNRLIHERDMNKKQATDPDVKAKDFNCVEAGKVVAYLKNCIYWINECIEGRESTETLRGVCDALIKNSKHLENTIRK